MEQTISMLSESRLDAPDAVLREEPFPFFIVRNQLPLDIADELEHDFPRYRSAGNFPFDPADCGPSINALVEELTSPSFANAIGKRLSIPDLGRYPTLVSMSRSLNKRHGTIHTDSRSKIVTALLYLNPEWAQTSAGCLRFLERFDDIASMLVPEIRPLYGTLATFRRADNSFHGHLPYQGERRVIQVAWLTSEEEKLRKTRRGRMSRFIKWVTRSVDQRLAPTRDRNASHRD